MVHVNFVEPRFVGQAVVFRTESSSRPGMFHWTFVFWNDEVQCTCEGFHFRQECKHTKIIDMSYAELLEVHKR